MSLSLLTVKLPSGVAATHKLKYHFLQVGLLSIQCFTLGAPTSYKQNKSNNNRKYTFTGLVLSDIKLHQLATFATLPPLKANSYLRGRFYCPWLGPYDFGDHRIVDGIMELANKNGIYC